MSNATQEFIARNGRELIRPRGVNIDPDSSSNTYAKFSKPAVAETTLRLDVDIGIRLRNSVSLAAIILVDQLPLCIGNAGLLAIGFYFFE